MRIESLVFTPGRETYSHNDQITLVDEEQYYIVWDEASIPIVSSSGKAINACREDMLAVENSEKIV